jgi:predicted nuclease with RNAse H fold
VLTVGVDLAAADDRTAMAAVAWEAGRATVRSVQFGVTDDEIVAAVRTADKAGLDCPLGWPAAFVTFVGAHQAGHPVRPAGANTVTGESGGHPSGPDGALWRRSLAYRVTDEVVRAETGLIPLSVSADRIAHAAFRCAALLARLADGATPVDRTGDGVVVEVYPAASLRRWGLTHRGYKARTGGAGHGFLVDELVAAAPWLDLGPHEPLCRTSHDAFDAVIAAMAARAAALGQVRAPGPAERAAAATEGWIALPTGHLPDLV